MDCRKALGLVVILFAAAAAGCTTSLPNLRAPSSTLKEDDDIVHKAPTYVRFGDFRARSAEDPKWTPAQRQELREDARLSYLKALEVDPKCVPAYVALARLRRVAEDHAGAAQLYGKALELTPDDPQVVFELGMCQCRAKDWTGAVDNLRKASELVPANKHFRTTMGYALARAGQWDEAYAVLSQVHGSAKAHYDLARMLRHVNQPEQARRHAAAALAADPAFEAARQLLGEMDDAPAYAQAATVSPRIVTPTNPAPAVPQAVSVAKLAAAEEAGPAPAPMEKSIRVPPLPVIRLPR